MPSVAIIGGGIAGLVAADALARHGHAVTIYERAPVLGGQAASFELAPGETVERFYHFICKDDQAYLQNVDALGIGDQLRWRTTQMGLFSHGELRPLGDPLSLLRFPHLSPVDKARFAWATVAAKLRSSQGWQDLEHVTARDWLRASYGPRTTELLFEPLLTSKFGAHAETLSAAWMWARLHRLGKSRTVLQQERIGYLVGGSQTYVDALEKALRERNVRLSPSTAVDRVVVEGDRATGVDVEGELVPFDAVLSTVPVPHTAKLFAGLDDAYFRNLRALQYLGVVVAVLRLREPFSRFYWMNVSDATLPMSGVIEATNLNPMPALGGDALIYIPQYVDADDPRLSGDAETLLASYVAALSRINPRFDASWVVDAWVHRERYTQPVCDVGFARTIPSISTSVRNLFITDSYQLNPHDRAISFSTELGQRAAALIEEAVA